MYYTIYKITNQINGKYYIGKHQTKKLDDGYMGSGKLLKLAIAKYGIDNFKKEILYIFDNEIDMNAKERDLVIVNESTYNLCDGGNGGFSYINRNGLYGFSNSDLARQGRELANTKLQKKYGDEWHTIISKLGGTIGREAYLDKLNDPTFKDKMLAISKKGRLAALSDSSKAKRKETMSLRNHQKGLNNSQFGTCWITNGTVNKKIKVQEIDTYISAGYYKGRTF